MSDVYFSSTNQKNPGAYRSSPPFNSVGDAILKMEKQNRLANELGIETRYHVASGDSRDFDKKDIRG